MRFEKALHWSDGLFLQQHHFQYLQRFFMTRDRLNRELLLAYPWGFIQVEVDAEALENLRVSVQNTAAVFPCGTEISMPGNVLIQPLDLKPLLTGNNEPFLVYLALPRYSENDGNLATDTGEKRLMLAEEVSCHDDYTGENEISMVTDRLNVRITTSLQDNSDLDLLPLMRLIPRSSGISEMKVEMDRNYIPPYLILNSCPAIMNRFRELITLMEHRRNKILSDLQVMGYTPDMFSGSVGQLIMQLSILNEYISRFSAFAANSSHTPYGIYLELGALAGNLSALQPLRNWEKISSYDHENCAPQFNELILWIRAMLLADGDNVFQQVVFVPDAEQRYLIAELAGEQLRDGCEYYLAVHCHGNAREIVNAVEKGDNFRMTGLQLRDKRVRGLKLDEMRYPPRYFPALPDTVWFKVDTEQNSAHIWQLICDERKIALDWAESVFPDLSATLFITMSEHGDTAK